MDESRDIRLLLSRNIKTARGVLRLSQARLAEYAGISLPHLIDIEHCKTWVSDKTLKKIALALNMEVFQLFTFPQETKKASNDGGEDSARLSGQLVSLANEKSAILKKETDRIFKDLVMEILHLHTE
jgi:transcriptional regulator with XRE-family HTH domain